MYTSLNATKGLSCGLATLSKYLLSCVFHTGQNKLGCNKWLIYLSRHMMVGHTSSQAYVSRWHVSELTVI